MNKEKKLATITIRTTNEQKEQLQRLADNQKRALGNMLYIWVIDRLEKESK